MNIDDLISRWQARQAVKPQPSKLDAVAEMLCDHLANRFYRVGEIGFCVKCGAEMPNQEKAYPHVTGAAQAKNSAQSKKRS
jgi:hypothetical protein